jgi:riboflavin transporter FmnP
LNRLLALQDMYFNRKSVVVSGTALLGALVFALDWIFKMAGLKIPFPYLQVLRFDLLGIPILIALFLFGFYSATTVSVVLMFSIGLRDPFSGVMRFIAEFATILGVYLVLRSRRPTSNFWKITSMGSGILSRVAVTSVANVLFLPVFLSVYYSSYSAVVVLVPAMALFNVLQGAISIFGGFLLYEAITTRIFSTNPKTNPPNASALPVKDK